ncbi:hypothetical protein HK104_003505 [Borealophlyctis nickersoniae]|nr:hypothetical protein HK104_003505 [Borealophlyctis nickersoniae]
MPTKDPILVAPHDTYPTSFPPAFTPEQAGQIDGFQKRLEEDVIPKEFTDEEKEKARRFCDPTCLRRYLVAHRWKLDDAVKGLRDTLLWRKEYKVDSITAEEIASEAKGATNYFNGFDIHGRPILYLKKKDGTENHQLNVRMLVHNIETAIKAMPAGVEKLLVIMDFTLYSRANSPPLSISRLTLHILSAHYPERLGATFMVNAPWVFNVFWTMFSPFVDVNTRAKIRFAKWTKGQEGISPLLQEVEAGMLECTYGGSLDFVYDHDVYWEAVSKVLGTK